MARALVWLGSLVLLVTLAYSSIYLPPPPQVFTASDKWLHLLVYAGIGCWFGLVFSQRFKWVLFLGLLCGLLLEYFQTFTIDRQASLWDAAANSLGYLSGLCAARVPGLVMKRPTPAS